jgi:6-phosphogluconolactonase
MMVGLREDDTRERMTTRRKFLAGLAVSPLAARGAWGQSSGGSEGAVLFVGTGTNTGSKGTYAYLFDSSSGALKPLGLAAEAPSPSFLALSPDGKTLFAVNEIDTYQGAKTGAVSSYALDKTGHLTLINTVASGGSGPCHVNTDQTGRVLLVANYTGGSAASFQIDWNGRLSNAVSEFHYEASAHGPNKDRQEASHAHHATPSPDNRFAYINDLGLDRIHIYKLDPATAKLKVNEPAEWKAAPGSGPRVLRFHPNGQWAYCVNELSSTIDLLNWHPQTGALTPVQKTELPVSKDFHGVSSAAEVIFDSKGKYAYASNRGDSFLMGFAIDQSNGKLTFPLRTSCGGKTPRHIALDPTEGWLLAANQDSNTIAAFRRDLTTGQLQESGPTASVQSPECLLFA